MLLAVSFFFVLYPARNPTRVLANQQYLDMHDGGAERLWVCYQESLSACCQSTFEVLHFFETRWEKGECREVYCIYRCGGVARDNGE